MIEEPLFRIAESLSTVEFAHIIAA